MSQTFVVDRAPEPDFVPPAPTPQARPLGLVALLKTLRRNPLECWARVHFDEPIVEGGLPIGHVLLVHEPQAIRRVLLDNAANYRKDRLQRRVLSAGLGAGLLSAEGEQWRAQRHAVAPIFARKTVMGFAPAMLEAAAAMVERLSRRADGTTVDLAVEMTRVTLEVLERTIFSDGLGRDAEAIRVAMATYFDAIGRIGLLDLLGAPDFFPRLSRLRVAPTLKFFDAAIDAVIADRRRRLAADPEHAPNDILTHLLATGAAMSEAEVRSNVLTFFAAGHETTANTLSWAAYLLSQSPLWRREVEAEADREFAGPADGLAERLVVTRAVIEEAVRLYPPIAAISRVALAPDELGGRPVKKGSLIVISPYVLHRRAALWERPAAFDPARFLGDVRDAVDRFAYLPFGAGPRTCIGAPFALQEATLVLASVVRRFRFALEPGFAVWPLLRVTLRPQGGLPVTLRRRRPQGAEAPRAARSTSGD